MQHKRCGRKVMRLATPQVIVHIEFVPPGQTVNQVLERLRKRVIRMRSAGQGNYFEGDNNDV